MGEGIEKGIKEITGCMEVYYKIITKRNNIKKILSFWNTKKKKKRWGGQDSSSCTDDDLLAV